MDYETKMILMLIVAIAVFLIAFYFVKKFPEKGE